MADQFETLKKLRELGVKSAKLNTQEQVLDVEFFPVAAPFDLEETEPSQVDDLESVNLPPAMARILKRGSVS